MREPQHDDSGYTTRVLRVNPAAPEAEPIAQAAEALRGGGLVAFPTETVYGLGANALDANAAARIFAAKGRPPNNPLIVHVPNAEAARPLVADWPETAARLAERFWPGPLTLVLPKSPAVPDIVTAGGPTVAIRVPAHPVADALLRACGVPIAAPSANRSSRLSPTRAEHVLRGLDGRIDLILDGGPTPNGLESAVLDLTTTPPRLLRPGPVSPAEIEAVIGPITRPGPAPVPIAPSGAPLASPGMMSRHYAPNARLELVEGDGGSAVESLRAQGVRVGWLTFTPPAALPPDVEIRVLPAEPTAYAAQLYEALHSLDAAGVQRILVDAPPETEAWLAIRDRLHRAATQTVPTEKESVL